MRLVLVGPPGAGKGTQAEFIAGHFGIPKISTGDIFRANVSGGTELGRMAKKFMDAGDLVPDEVTNAMVRDRLAEPDAAEGFLLDGFPRNVAQAGELAGILDELGSPLSVVLDLEVDFEEVVKRLSGRRTCKKCGHVWHVEYDPPSQENACDRCGGELYQRDDDKPDTVRHRLDVYAEQTAPLIEYYRDRGALVSIGALGAVEDVTERAIEALTPFADSMTMRAFPERIQLKTPDQIAHMREAGLVVARALGEMRSAAAPGVSTADLDAVARDVLKDAGATPSFLNYHGYPAVICASVNDRVVHGIPSDAEKLREGDLISIDFGAIIDGWHGDSAISVEIGTVEPEVAALSAACEASMWDGLAAARSGARLSDISHAVETSVRSSGRYGIVAGYGGHGIGSQMHMAPHILNYGRPGKGPRLTPGMALAIEPMITLGSRATEELDDGWTVVTVDGSAAAHWEHTVAILEDGPWVLTAEDGGRAELEKRGVQLSALAA